MSVVPLPAPEDEAADAINRPALKAHYLKLYQQMSKRVTAEVVLVTVEMASDWLSRNKGNRPLGTPTIEHYTRLMSAVEWMVNGEPVIIDETDNLLDGQHRLEAVVRTGVPIPMLVVYGVPSGAFATLNTGKTRSLADVLAIKGERNQRTLAGAIRWLAAHLRGSLKSFRNTVKLSNHELAHLLGEHPGLRDAVEFAAPLCKRGLHQPALVSFLYYEMARRHRRTAEEFFTRVLGQTDIANGSPEDRLNNWIVRNAGDTATRGRAVHYMAIWVKAWNQRVRGGTTNLMWRPEGNEPFPDFA